MGAAPLAGWGVHAPKMDGIPDAIFRPQA